MRSHRLPGLALALGLAIVLVLPAFAEPTRIKVDGAVIKGYITHLASDASLGRRTLTPGYERAAEWAASTINQAPSSCDSDSLPALRRSFRGIMTKPHP